MTLSESENLAGIISNGIATALSFFGGLYMLITYYSSPFMHCFAMKLVMSLVIMDFINTISNAMIYFDSESMCIAQSFLRTFGEMASTLWALAICFISYSQIKWSEIAWDRYYKTILILVTLLALFPAVWSLFSQFFDGPIQIKKVDSVCGMSPDGWNLGLKYIPIWVCLVLIAIFSYLTKKQLKSITEGLVNQEFGRIFWYPLILIIIWLPTTLVHIYSFFFNTYASFFWQLLRLTFTRMLGFFNFIVYGIQYRKTRKQTDMQARSYTTINMSQDIRRASDYNFRPKESH